MSSFGQKKNKKKKLENGMSFITSHCLSNVFDSFLQFFFSLTGESGDGSLSEAPAMNYMGRGWSTRVAKTNLRVIMWTVECLPMHEKL